MDCWRQNNFDYGNFRTRFSLCEPLTQETALGPCGAIALGKLAREAAPRAAPCPMRLPESEIAAR